MANFSIGDRVIGRLGATEDGESISMCKGTIIDKTHSRDDQSLLVQFDDCDTIRNNEINKSKETVGGQTYHRTWWCSEYNLLPMTSDSKIITIMRYEDAPEHLQLSRRPGKKEVWIAEVPPHFNQTYLAFLDSFTLFGHDVIELHHPINDGWTVRIAYRV